MVGQPTSPLCGSAWGLERWQCCCLASGGLPGTCPISRSFTHCLYATGTLPAVPLVLNPDGWVCIHLRPCRLFKWSFLKIWQFLPPPQHPLVFIAKSYGDLPSQRWNPSYAVWLGLQLLAPNVSLLIFIHHTWMGDCPFCCCLSVSRRISASPTCLDKHGFFKSLVVGLPFSLISW